MGRYDNEYHGDEPEIEAELRLCEEARKESRADDWKYIDLEECIDE